MAIATAIPNSQRDVMTIEGLSEVEVPFACEDEPPVDGVTVTALLAVLDGAAVAPRAAPIPAFFLYALDFLPSQTGCAYEQLRFSTAEQSVSLRMQAAMQTRSHTVGHGRQNNRHSAWTRQDGFACGDVRAVLHGRGFRGRVLRLEVIKFRVLGEDAHGLVIVTVVRLEVADSVATSIHRLGQDCRLLRQFEAIGKSVRSITYSGSLRDFVQY